MIQQYVKAAVQLHAVRSSLIPTSRESSPPALPMRLLSGEPWSIAKIDPNPSSGFLYVKFSRDDGRKIELIDTQHNGWTFAKIGFQNQFTSGSLVYGCLRQELTLRGMDIFVEHDHWYQVCQSLLGTAQVDPTNILLPGALLFENILNAVIN